MEMLTLEDAWRWVQVGVCAGIGAFIPLMIVAAALSNVAAALYGRSAPVDPQEYPEPHCSLCCPNTDDEFF